MRQARRRQVAFFLLALAGVAACDGRPGADDAVDTIRVPETARVAQAAEAIDGAYVPALDPMTMNGAEIEKILGAVAFCEFRYTSAGPPVLAVTAAPAQPLAAVVKLNGHLVELEPEAAGVAEAGGVTLVAGPVRIRVEPDAPQPADAHWRSEAAMVFAIDRRLHVGYRGYYGCASARSDGQHVARDGPR